MATMSPSDFIACLLSTVVIAVCQPALAQSGLNADQTDALPTAPTLRTDPPIKLGFRTLLTTSDVRATTSSEESQKDGAVVEISPYVQAHFSRPDRYFDLRYLLRNFYRTVDRQSEWARHDLRAQGETAVVGDWLRLAARAFVYDVITNPFGLVSVDPATQTTNKSRFSSVDIAPVIRGEAANEARYELRYGFNQTRYDNALQSSVGNRLSALIVRSPVYGGIGWGGAFDTERRAYENGVSVDIERGWLGPFVQPIREVQIGVSANYARNSLLFNQAGANSSWGPGINVLWLPSPRTVLYMTTSRAYYGTVARMRLSVRQRQWLFGLRYDRDVVGNLTTSANYIDPINVLRPVKDEAQELDPLSQRLSDRGVLPAFASPLANTGINAPLVRNRALSATVGYVGLRDSLLVSTSYANRASVSASELVAGSNILFADLQQTNLSLDWRRSLSPTVAAGSFVRWSKSGTNDGSLRSTVSVLGASVSFALADQSGLSFLIRRTHQRVIGSSFTEYVENALISTFDFRF